MCHIGVFDVLYLSARCVILECSVCKILVLDVLNQSEYTPVNLSSKRIYHSTQQINVKRIYHALN